MNRIIKLFLLLTCFSSVVCLSACDSQFSKYEKNGETDVEKASLKGKVKQYTEYLNGHLERITSFNKWGFITEEKEFEDSKLKSTTTYKYNEFGLLVEKNCVYEDEDEDMNKSLLTTYEYDDNHNLISVKYSETENGIKGKEKLRFRFKNIYEGEVLVRQNVYSSESSELGNYYVHHYNQGGKIIRKQRVDEHGKINEFMAYKYYADGSLYQTLFLYPDGQVIEYWEEIYEPDSKGRYEPIIRRHIWPNSPESNSEQEIKYNGNRDVISYSYNNNLEYEIEYQYDEHGNWIYKKETSYSNDGWRFDDGQNGSRNFYEKRREIKYY